MARMPPSISFVDFLVKFLVPAETTEADLADLLKRAFFYVGGAIQIAANHQTAFRSSITTRRCRALLQPTPR